MRNEHFESIQADPEIPTEAVAITNEYQEASPEKLMAKLAPLLTPHSAFADKFYARVYQFSPSCANQEDAVILDCLRSCSGNERGRITQVIANITLENIGNEGRSVAAEQIANILFNSAHVEERRDALSVKVGLMELLAKTHSAFASKLYTQLYIYNPNCANREDELIGEQILTCSEEELASIGRLMSAMRYPDVDMGAQAELAGEIAKILFKTIH